MNLLFILLLLVLVALDIMAFTEIVQLLRAPSDNAVLKGVVFFALLIILNYFLLRFLFSKIKNR
ncbi:hypothetical protein [Rufibacter latericius]|uniref:Uncharacterized protein n=1 Tax=Rufibacter latericius TaxID=2487040 RepID=A0A3M9N346_9BACT|nr:hypothetical protein [Rufibacter latericius]RNI31593.1 hypothetical protein EFB08_03500 [Rufibacter latericius]